MDKLLSSFTKKYINKLEIDDLNDLEKFLNMDDTNLYNFYNSLNTNIKFKKNKINSLFKNFKYVD